MRGLSTPGSCVKDTGLPCPPEHVIVVIPALNEAKAIAACLASLKADQPFMAGVRIVVADGGSTDGTREIVNRLAAQDPMLKLMNNPDRLQSAGINRAVAQEAGPQHRILVRCDAHAVYPPDYVRRIAETLMARPEAASVATVMDAVGNRGFARACAWVVDTPIGSGGSQHRGGLRSQWVDHGHHAGFRLNWFRRIGGYDPSFSHNEDAEYDRRLVQAGGRVWLAADIRMTYHVRPAPRALLKQYWNYGQGRARTVLTHRMRPRLRQLLPVVNALGVILGVILGISGSVLAALLVSPLGTAGSPLALLWTLIWPLAYGLLLLAVSLVGMRHLRSPAGLWAGPALGIMHMAWGLGFLRLCLSQALRRQPLLAYGPKP